MDDRAKDKGFVGELRTTANVVADVHPSYVAGLLRRAAVRIEELRAGPVVVCLCGSTRFRDAYAKAYYEEEHAGRIVLSVPCYKDDPCCKGPEDHERLDRLHLAKIDMADEILVLNVGGYVGHSTGREIGYAVAKGKRVRYLEPIGEVVH